MGWGIRPPWKTEGSSSHRTADTPLRPKTGAISLRGKPNLLRDNPKEHDFEFH
jgi:hypothetical protein